MTIERGIVVSSLAASVLALGMLVLAMTTGVSQEWFELVHTTAEYGGRLVAQDATLRLAFTFDDLFLLSYATFFALFCVERWNRSPRVLVVLQLVFGELTAVLDMAENHHILAMLAASKIGVLPTAGDITFQVLESAVKFHVSYLAMIFAAFIYPREKILGRLVAWGTGLVYPILGAVAFTAPPDLVAWLSLARVLFFVVGLAASAYLYATKSTSTEV